VALVHRRTCEPCSTLSSFPSFSLLSYSFPPSRYSPTPSVVPIVDIDPPPVQVAYKAIPRMQFGHLQSKLFPHFFRLQTGTSLALLYLYSKAGNLSLRSAATWKTSKNLWLLALMAGSAVLNQFLVGPITTSALLLFFPFPLKRIDPCLDEQRS
jgi:hypothetical protein